MLVDCVTARSPAILVSPLPPSTVNIVPWIFRDPSLAVTANISPFTFKSEPTSRVLIRSVAPLTFSDPLIAVSPVVPTTVSLRFAVGPTLKSDTTPSVPAIVVSPPTVSPLIRDVSPSTCRAFSSTVFSLTSSVPFTAVLPVSAATVS